MHANEEGEESLQHSLSLVSGVQAVNTCWTIDDQE